MDIASTLRTTLLLIGCCLWPPAKKRGRPAGAPPVDPSPVQLSPLSVTAAEIPWYCADFNRALLAGRRLSLFFPATASPAAPFILFRLKRSGFSNCLVIADRSGLTVFADR